MTERERERERAGSGGFSAGSALLESLREAPLAELEPGLEPEQSGAGAGPRGVGPGARAGAGARTGAGAGASAARSWSPEPEQTLWRAAMDRMSDLRQLEEEREARDSGQARKGKKTGKHERNSVGQPAEHGPYHKEKPNHQAADEHHHLLPSCSLVLVGQLQLLHPCRHCLQVLCNPRLNAVHVLTLSLDLQSQPLRRRLNTMQPRQPTIRSCRVGGVP